ncbi:MULTISPECIES: phasin family protein [unclassified Thauera]|uniref:phasin family protein n=1 Tax=unclassified Thauera TaxID=2609274 RepID=UPI0022DD9A3B|nr:MULTISPECIES: phasin family protein [unclassified Thauera]WBL65964.1 phasin family protein [Thauera sp. WB-2]HNS93027.1 phasin family protein [Thauera sp.]
MIHQPNVEKFSANAQASIEHLEAYAQITLSAAEKLLALNLDTARTLCELASNSGAQLESGDLRSALATQGATQSKGFEHLTSYLRDVSKLCVQTQSEVVEVGSRQFADLQRTMQSMFEEAGKLSKVNPLEVIVPATSTASRTRKAA